MGTCLRLWLSVVRQKLRGVCVVISGTSPQNEGRFCMATVNSAKAELARVVLPPNKPARSGVQSPPFWCMTRGGQMLQRAVVP
jgi:hypothetical protein